MQFSICLSCAGVTTMYYKQDTSKHRSTIIQQAPSLDARGWWCSGPGDIRPYASKAKAQHRTTLIADMGVAGFPRSRNSIARPDKLEAATNRTPMEFIWTSSNERATPGYDYHSSQIIVILK